MPDDLVARLRAKGLSWNTEAADRIEALEAELADAKRDTLRCHEAEIAHDAVIAEALARSEDGAHSAETPAFTLIAVRTILAAARVPQGAAEASDPVDSAIDTLAHYIIWQQIDPERVEWEDWPELGEFDFERLVKRVEELAPSAPDLNERRDAQEYLKNRISYDVEEGKP